MNDVILNKVAIIERCINRIHEVYQHNPDILKDLTKQDCIIMNIQRAANASIDLCMHIISEKKLGIPVVSNDAFKLLQEASIIDESLATSLMNMVNFSNIAVHNYQTIELEILEMIIEKHLTDFKVYTKIILLTLSDK